MTINQLTQEHITEQTLAGANHLKDGTGNTLGITIKVWAVWAPEMQISRVKTK
jgi:hypothetical protein